MSSVATSKFVMSNVETYSQNARAASLPAWFNWFACMLLLCVALFQMNSAQAQAVWSNMQAVGGGTLTPPATTISGGISGSVKVGHGGDTIAAVYLYEAGNPNALATQLYSTAGMPEFPPDYLRGFWLTAQLPAGVHQLYVTSYPLNGEPADSVIFTVTVTAPATNPPTTPPTNPPATDSNAVTAALNVIYSVLFDDDDANTPTTPPDGGTGGSGGTGGTGTGTSGGVTLASLSTPHLNNLDAGSLPGTLDVGRDGASTYSIEIAVPPGTAGMQPKLSLNYSSNGSNGQLGLGWSLGGTSTIHRCAKTLAQDGQNGRISFDKGDRLCLDGMRLVRENGTQPGSGEAAKDDAYWADGGVYRTEIESFTSVQYVQALGGFKVEGKDGIIRYYGGTANGRIAAQGRNDGQPLLWALTSTEDRSGNYMYAQYDTDASTGEYTLANIVYTANGKINQSPDAKVHFEYERNRPDAQVQYFAGSRNDLRSRLTHIQTFIGVNADGSGGTLVRDLAIRYKQSATSGRSLVESIQACTLDGNCLPETKFEWGQDTLALREIKEFTQQEVHLIVASVGAPNYMYEADFDGDGVRDRIFPEITVVCPADPSCVLIPTDDGRGNENAPYFSLTGKFDVFLNDGSRVQSQFQMMDGQPFPSKPLLPSRIASLIVADLNGDGRDDVVLVTASKKFPYYCLNSGAAIFNCYPWTAAWNGVGEQGVSVVDMFNSKRAHILIGLSASCFLDQNNQLQCIKLDVVNTTSTPGQQDPVKMITFAPSAVDFSKQGISDFYSIYNAPVGPGIPPMSGVATCVNKPVVVAGTLRFECQTIRQWDTWSGATGAESVGDLNGDGLTDFAFSVRDEAAYVCLGKESGSDCQSAGPSWVVGGGEIRRAYIGDFTGDGTTDLLIIYLTGKPLAETRADICRLDVNRKLQCQTVPITIPAGYPTQSTIQQIDASGIPRLIYTNYKNATINGDVKTLTSKAFSFAFPASQDRLTAVTNGFRARDEVTYARSDDPEVYSRVATIDGIARKPAYPQVAVNPGVMVKELRRAVGAADKVHTNFNYAGAMADGEGRGSLGFAFTRTQTQESGIFVEQVFEQTFPKAGLVSKTRKGKAGANCRMEDTGMSYEQQEKLLPSGAKTYFVAPRDVTSILKDLDCSEFGTVTTTNRYTDGWGNLNEQTARTVQQDGKWFETATTTRYWTEKNVNFLSGLPTNVVVTKTTSELSAKSRTVASAYDEFTGLRKTETTEPGNAALSVTSTFDRSGNSFGLVNKTLLSWTNPACVDPNWPEGSNCQVQQNYAVSSVVYDARGKFPSTVSNANGDTETHNYDPATGARRSVVDANGLATSWDIDSFGRTKVEHHFDRTETRAFLKQCDSKCPAGAVSARITERYIGTSRIAVPEIVYLDNIGHPIQTMTWTFDGSESVADMRYDNRGRLYETDQPHVRGVQARLASRQNYDDLDRITSIQTPLENAQLATAETFYRGRVTSYVNARRQNREETRNAIGHLQQVELFAPDLTDRNLTTFTYDVFGNLTTTTDPNLNVVTVEYDLLGRRTKLIDLDLGEIEYKVNPLGQVWSQTSAKQKVANAKNPPQLEKTRFMLDKLGRMTRRLETDLDSRWEYDTAPMGKGKLAKAYTMLGQNVDYLREHKYDDLGRPKLTSTKLLGGTFTSEQTYDAWGRPATTTYSNPHTAAKAYTKQYNNQGYLFAIDRAGKVLWTVTAQDAAGRVRNVALGNTLSVRKDYDAASGRFTGATTQTASGAIVLVEGYEYDELGSVSTRNQIWRDSMFRETMHYDGLNRLKDSKVDDRTLQEYKYDAAGNIIWTTANGTYSYGLQGAGTKRPHAVIGIAALGYTSFIYDDNGNLTNGAGRKMDWTSFDMPSRIVKGDQSADFVYGPEHQRTRQIRGDKSEIVYAGAQEVEKDSLGAATVKTYWPGGLGMEIDKPGQATVKYWTHADRLGSIVAITDESGEEKERLEYDVWGKRRSALDHASVSNEIDGKTDNKGFTNHEMLDKLDLVHMNGRVYDPQIGKFLSPDLLVTEPTNGQNYNRYAYVLNNPTNLTDPTGYAQQVQNRKERLDSKEIEQLKPQCESSCVAENADGTGTASRTKSGATGGASDRTEKSANTTRNDIIREATLASPNPSVSQLTPCVGREGTCAAGLGAGLGGGWLAGTSLGRAMLSFFGLASEVQSMADGVPPAGRAAGAAQQAAALEKGALINELSSNGVKFNAQNIVDIRRLADGRIVFLETGNAKAGLQHIMGAHGDDFARAGVPAGSVPTVVMDAVSHGKIVGYQGRDAGRPIYELPNGQRVAVTVGSNGFVVGANPAGR